MPFLADDHFVLDLRWALGGWLVPWWADQRAGESYDERLALAPLGICCMTMAKVAPSFLRVRKPARKGSVVAVAPKHFI
jgi:hypothetical protein